MLPVPFVTHAPQPMPTCDLFVSGQVDVFLPRYKEPWSLYGPVVQSALDINYPPSKLNVYVLDDGRSDPVKQCLQVCLHVDACYAVLSFSIIPARLCSTYS